jgi:hypothetical protein
MNPEKQARTAAKPRQSPSISSSPKVQTRQISSAPISGSQLLTKLGLPLDKLSASLVSFARFFSLPLDPGLLAKIRRQALQPGPPAPDKPAGQTAPEQTLDQAQSLKSREALSLAATAAVCKGVELSPKALKDYALYLSGEDPESLEDAQAPDPDGRGSASGTEPKNGGSGNQSKENPDSQNGENPFADPVYLKEKTLALEQGRPLLNLMNRLPARDGRRWIALPFSFTHAGDLYQIVLRILLNGGNMEGTGNRMALEITKTSIAADNSSDSEQHWLFIMDTFTGQSPRLELQLEPFPEKQRKASLIRELSETLGIPAAYISFKSGGNAYSFAPDSRNEVLLSINEQV